jgi:hypothetical protein
MARDHHAELLAAAKARGAMITDCGQGHFQIRGALLVNYYPNAKRQTAYIAGTRHGKLFVNPQQAVALAFKPPEFRPGEVERKNYRKVKVRMFKRQKKCHWCSEKLTLDTATVDHVIPLSRGGLDNDNNRVLACSPCNQRRGHAMPEIRA